LERLKVSQFNKGPNSSLAGANLALDEVSIASPANQDEAGLEALDPLDADLGLGAELREQISEEADVQDGPGLDHDFSADIDTDLDLSADPKSVGRKSRKRAGRGLFRRPGRYIKTIFDRIVSFIAKLIKNLLNRLVPENRPLRAGKLLLKKKKDDKDKKKASR